MRATEYFARGCDPSTLVVRQIMEDAVVTTSPASSAMGVAELLSEQSFGSLPVKITAEVDGLRTWKFAKSPSVRLFWISGRLGNSNESKTLAKAITCL